MKISRWLTVGLESGIHWPTTEVKVAFQGNEFLLRPETDKLAPSVALAYDPPMTDKEALRLIRQFLSSLSWVERGHLRETLMFGTGGCPGGVGKGPGVRLLSPKFRVDYLPETSDPKA